jgi:hypothetical protein
MREKNFSSLEELKQHTKDHFHFSFACLDITDQMQKKSRTINDTIINLRLDTLAETIALNNWELVLHFVRHFYPQATSFLGS